MFDLAISTTTIWGSTAVFLVLILLLVILLLLAQKKLVPSGNVEIIVNDEKKLSVPQGGSLLTTLQNEGIYLSSACGGQGTCAQCKCQVVDGGGEILVTEKPHFTRKEINSAYRLSCQV